MLSATFGKSLGMPENRLSIMTNIAGTALHPKVKMAKLTSARGRGALWSATLGLDQCIWAVFRVTSKAATHFQDAPSTA